MNDRLSLNDKRVYSGTTHARDPQRFVPRVFICAGEEPWAHAIKRAIVLFTSFECHVLATTEPATICDLVRRRRPTDDDVCLARSSGSAAEAAATCLQTVLRLRNKVRWQGGYIAVVDGPSVAAVVNDMGLAVFEKAHSRESIRFAEVAGHMCIAEPLQIEAVMESLVTVGFLYKRDWDDLPIHAGLKSLIEAADDALALLAAGASTGIDVCVEVKRRFCQTRFESLRDHGDTFKRAQGICSAEDPKTAEEARLLLSEIHEILRPVTGRRHG